MSLTNEYTRIREKIETTYYTNEQFSFIKRLFQPKIDSERLFGRIRDINALIRVLEKRDCLSDDDPSAFIIIAEALDRRDLLTPLTNYNKPVNVSVLPSKDISKENQNRVIPSVDSEPIQRVFNVICTDIGSKWKDFARALKVREGHIDDLEIRYQRIPDMVREVLIYHKESSDPTYWKVNLCEGLTKARRSDLSETVQKIFAMHGMM